MSKMIEVKTAELIGMALDWAVAQALGYSEGEDAYCNPAWFDGYRYVASKNEWRPSTDWGHGGPLIDKFSVRVIRHFNPDWNGGHWRADVFCRYFGLPCATTPLVAICRTVVALKLGEVVKVPAQLLERAQ